jgi:hypothetical protein
METIQILKRQFRIAPHVRASLQGDRIVILDTNQGKLYLCEGPTAYVWKGISEGKSPDTIFDEISQHAGTAPAQARETAEEFLRELIELELVVGQAAQRRIAFLPLLMRAMWELIAYDLRMALFGFRRVHSTLMRRTCVPKTAWVDDDQVARIVNAASTATSLYWRPVKCLHRSAATTRLLRTFGIPAQLIIGYRAKPFLSHAWVEVDGRVVNDSPALAQRLTVLERV